MILRKIGVFPDLLQPQVTGLELPNFWGTATLALTFVAKIGHQGNCQRHQGHTVNFRRAARQNPTR